jgi:hypothetical protein
MLLPTDRKLLLQIVPRCGWCAVLLPRPDCTYILSHRPPTTVRICISSLPKVAVAHNRSFSRASLQYHCRASGELRLRFHSDNGRPPRDLLPSRQCPTRVPSRRARAAAPSPVPRENSRLMKFSWLTMTTWYEHCYRSTHLCSLTPIGRP